MTLQSQAVRDELAKLRGRDLGSCAACGRTVFFEHNFMRMQGRVVHVRCPVGARRQVPPAAAPAPAAARMIAAVTAVPLSQRPIRPRVAR